MSAAAVRGLGLGMTLVYAGIVAWVYVQRPQSLAEMKGSLTDTVGLYTIDTARFEEGRRLLHGESFAQARAAFERADPARRDAVTQFYVAYTFYRQGWGRFYNDDALFRQALHALDRAASLSPAGPVRVSDPGLGLPDSEALRGELQRGLAVEPGDFNPLRVLRKRH